MTALRLEDQASAHSAELEPLSMPDLARRRAAIVVCAQARSADEARELLDMLGLADLPAAPRPTPAAPKPTPTAPHPTIPDPPPAAPTSVSVPCPRPADQAESRRAVATGAGRTDTAAARVDSPGLDDGLPLAGECVGCRRHMVRQSAYNQTWRDRGFVQHGGRGRCKGCYGAWRRQAPQPASANRPRTTVGVLALADLTSRWEQRCTPQGLSLDETVALLGEIRALTSPRTPARAGGDR